jgi:hypothetical protein
VEGMLSKGWRALSPRDLSRIKCVLSDGFPVARSIFSNQLVGAFACPANLEPLYFCKAGLDHLADAQQNGHSGNDFLATYPIYSGISSLHKMAHSTEEGKKCQAKK